MNIRLTYLYDKVHQLKELTEKVCKEKILEIGTEKSL